MKATIWHNPNCGTSRNTLAILRETPGVEVEVVEYLKAGWEAATLKRLFAGAGMTAAQALRTRGTDVIERGLDRADEATIIAAMVAEPGLVERPFVETAKGARLCRPKERVGEIL
jgi:arsenate reductase (glutaredoxin)